MHRTLGSCILWCLYTRHIPLIQVLFHTRLHLLDPSGGSTRLNWAFSLFSSHLYKQTVFYEYHYYLVHWSRRWSGFMEDCIKNMWNVWIVLQSYIVRVLSFFSFCTVWALAFVGLKSFWYSQIIYKTPSLRIVGGQLPWDYTLYGHKLYYYYCDIDIRRRRSTVK